jgi:hypothetical protein
VNRYVRSAAAVSAAAVAGLLALGAGVLTAAPAAAAAVPYHDPQAKGYIAFCDDHGRSITAGNVNDLPFAAMAISSEAAPAAYQVKGRRATLFMYQPRKDVPPGDWSGQQISGTSLYGTPSHPTVQITTGDKALGQALYAFPPQWQGLMQLRMYLSAPNKQVYRLQYAATDIRISGQFWQAVDGGTIACSSGSATSTEKLLLPPSSFPKPSTAAARPSAGAGSPSAAGGGSSGSSGSTGGAVAAPDGSPNASAAGDSSVSPVLVGLLGVAIGGAAALGIVAARNRRRST